MMTGDKNVYGNGTNKLSALNLFFNSTVPPISLSLCRKNQMSGLQLTQFVRRPAQPGKAGRTIRVRANFFEVTSLPDQNVIHYDITITPDVPPALNRRIYQQFEHMNSKGQLGGIRPVYDGRCACRV